MVHEHPRANIISEDGCSCFLSPSIQVIVCLRRIHFGQKKSSLAVPVLHVNASRHLQPRLQDLLCVVQGRLQEVLKVFLLGHVLVACFPPLGYGLTKINDNLEESVHEQNSVSKNAAAVQEHRLQHSERTAWVLPWCPHGHLPAPCPGPASPTPFGQLQGRIYTAGRFTPSSCQVPTFCSDWAALGFNFVQERDLNNLSSTRMQDEC